MSDRPPLARGDGAEMPRPRKQRQPLIVTGLVRVWIVSADLTTVHTHWTGRRCLPCRIRTLHERECPHCVANEARRVQHWLTVQDEAVRREPVLVQLTPHTLTYCPAIGESDGALWGRLLKLWRRDGRINSALNAALVPTVEPPALWDAPPTLSVLLRMWGAPLSGDVAPGQPRVFRPDTLEGPDCPGADIPW